MNEVVVINSFRNHCSSLYPIKNQKSIAGNWTKKTVVRHFNREFFLLSPIILLCYFPKILIFTIFQPLNIIYNSKFYLCGRESDEKKFNSMRCGADSCRFYQCVFLKCDRFVNACEPAAVLGFPEKVKVAERIQPESTAAGSLFGWSLGGKVSGVSGVSEVSKVSKVSGVSEVSKVSGVSKVSEFSGERKKEVIMNIEQGISNVEGREGGGQRTGDRENR
jgi:hypothetical protein